MLEVIQQEQRLSSGEGVQQAFGEGEPFHLADVKGLGDGRGDEAGVGEGGQVDEADPAGHGRGDGGREAGLPGASGAGQAHQARLGAGQEVAQGP
ncbi:MAG TPA: hypothetical protein VHQ00_06235 [Chloroflexota bacterium]|nr:hypothetical protein [Chloroflexota bacterium]